MFSLNRFNSKELALAYVGSQQHSLSEEEFLEAVNRAELKFSRLLNASQQPQHYHPAAYSFEG